jgi:serine/threonine-protein kinase
MDGAPSAPGTLASGSAHAAPDPDAATVAYTPGGAAADPSGGGAARTYVPRGQAAAVPATVAGYEVLSVLGRGAMGVVYQARQRGLRRVVALKMILAGEYAGEGDVARFKTEAEAVARLQHANIVQIYEVGEEDGRPFFSLEYVDGGSLAKKVSGTPLPPRQAADVARLLAEGMHCAHEHGVVHRDLKPANVLLTRDGSPKVTDFGLAKRLEDDSGQTRSGTIVGTPSYMAPEQAEGRLKDVGPLADVYGLGAVLYEMLTGRPPFRAESVLETLQQVRQQEPVPPHLLQPKVPRDLETICLKCLQKEPHRRYASADDLADDLRRFLAGEPIRARPVPAWERFARWCRRNPRLAALAGAVVALLVAIAAGSLGFAWQIRAKNEELHGKNDQLNEKNDELRLSNQAKEEARQQAVASFEEARDKHFEAYQQMLGLGEEILRRLALERQARPGAAEAALREDMVRLVTARLLGMAQELDRSRVTKFSRIHGSVALADLLAHYGRKDEALEQDEKAVSLLREMLAADPRSDLARANLAQVLSRVAALKAELHGDLKGARDLARQSLTLQQDVADHPQGDTYKPLDNLRLLSQYRVLAGKLALRKGDPAAARADLTEAVRLREAWNAAIPPQMVHPKAQTESYLGEAYLWLAVACSHLNDPSSSAAAFGKVLGLCQGLADRFPRDASFQEDLAEFYGALGDARLRRGKVVDAWKDYDRALTGARGALAAEPTNLARQDLLARTHGRLGNAAALLPERRGEAAGHYQEALRLREGLRKEEPHDLLVEAAYALELARCGRSAEAATGAEGLHRRALGDSEVLLLVAGSFARCAAGAKDSAAKQRYADQAIAALVDAVGQGYKDAVVLRTEPDLEAIRTEPGFRSLLARAAER